MDTKSLNLFEYATRKKLRFSTSKGSLSTEDLWDLSLESLNTIAKSLNKKIKESDEEDFIHRSSKSSENTSLQVSFEIVKYIINVKLDEKSSRLEEIKKSEKLRKLTEALERAESKDLESKSADELRKMIDELNG